MSNFCVKFLNKLFTRIIIILYTLLIVKSLVTYFDGIDIKHSMINEVTIVFQFQFQRETSLELFS